MKVSHAQMSRIGCGSLLTSRHIRAKLYTANAATTSNVSCEWSAWITCVEVMCRASRLPCCSYRDAYLVFPKWSVRHLWLVLLSENSLRSDSSPSRTWCLLAPLTKYTKRFTHSQHGSRLARHLTHTTYWKLECFELWIHQLRRNAVKAMKAVFYKFNMVSSVEVWQGRRGDGHKSVKQSLRVS